MVRGARRLPFCFQALTTAHGSYAARRTSEAATLSLAAMICTVRAVARPTAACPLSRPVEPVSPPTRGHPGQRLAAMPSWWRRRVLPPRPKRLFRPASTVIAGSPRRGSYSMDQA